jgi:membrane protein YdbS with pleckstrin-like domain
MRKILKTKIDKEFKPSPQFKKLYCTYLTLAILVFILPWLIPIIFFAPAIPALFVSVIFLIILIFTAYWIPKYYDTIFYKLTKNEIFWKRGVWFKTTGIVPYNRITNVDIIQGPISRKFGIASLKVQTAGYSAASRASAEIRLEGIENFGELREVIMDFIDKKRPMAVETYEEEDVNQKILKELVKIRKSLKKPSGR